MDRQLDAALAWAEQELGGKILSKEAQSRWRPQWLLQVDRGNGPEQIILRGYRNPYDGDLQREKNFLTTEAAYLQAMEDVPVRFPRVYGHNAELGWSLMEQLPGEAKLVGIEPEARRHALFRRYTEELAKLHAFPIEKFKLPAGVEIPKSCNDFRTKVAEKHTAYYRAIDRKYGEPAMELGLQWAGANQIKDERPISLALHDVGANQFMFDGDEFIAIIDVEFIMLADPLLDIGMMRTRDITCHTGGMREHVLHYGAEYEKLTGISLSMDSLFYWTIAGPAFWNVFIKPTVQTPWADLIDTAFTFSWEPQQMRSILEGLAEKYDIALDPPPAPRTASTMNDVLFQLMVDQFDAYFAGAKDDDTHRLFTRYSKSIAQTLQLANTSAVEFDRDNREELGELLGHPVDDFAAAMFELEHAIRDDHMRDLDHRLRFLHRFELRREMLYRPMQEATGVVPMKPLPRM